MNKYFAQMIESLEDRISGLEEENGELRGAILRACEYAEDMKDLARLIKYHDKDDAIAAFDKLYETADGGGNK
ncbi:hypothetical protein [Arcanobacterium haemolyticum]